MPKRHQEVARAGTVSAGRPSGRWQGDSAAKRTPQGLYARSGERGAHDQRGEANLNGDGDEGEQMVEAVSPKKDQRMNNQKTITTFNQCYKIRSSITERGEEQLIAYFV